MSTITKPINITDDSFEKIISSTEKPIIVDFWAAWCGPCHMMVPVLDEVAEEYQGKALITKLDVDANPQTAAKYSIRSIPTLLVFKEGKVVDKQIGASPKNVVTEKIDKYL